MVSVLLIGCNNNPQQTSVIIRDDSNQTTKLYDDRGPEDGLKIRTGIKRRRRALVIGNSTYNKMPNWRPLVNPKHDAEDMTKALQQLGFQVTTLQDATLKMMDYEILKFGRNTEDNDIVLFFFAGHGMQVKGENFLLPVDAEFKEEHEIERVTIKTSLILNKLQRAATKLIFLDACRFNPFADKGIRAGTFRGGLARMNAPSGTLLVYSTDPDRFAADSVGGRNSPFTHSLLKYIRTPGVDAQIMLRKVRGDVKRATKNTQTPWDASSLEGSFYFVPPNTVLEPEMVSIPAGSFMMGSPNNKKRLGNQGLNRRFLAKGSRIGVYRLVKTQYLDLQPRYSFNSYDDYSFNGYQQPLVKAIWNGTVDYSKWSLQGIRKDYPGDTRLQYAASPGGVRANPKIWERPQHKVQIKAFKMSKYEITNAQYRVFRPNHDSGNYENQSLNEEQQPVVNIMWHDANAYTKWLSKKTGKKYRLPTEAEWEYAARAGTNTSRYWGDDPNQACKYANVNDQKFKNKFSRGGNHGCDDGYAVAAPVGRYLANPFGLHDMLGNVQEWTLDNWHDNYDGAPTDGSAWISYSDFDSHVTRGGSWRDSPIYIRSAARQKYRHQDEEVGFRVVLEP